MNVEANDPTQRARAAVSRAAWAEAYAQFRSVDPASLSAVDLELMADAAWWLSAIDESLTARLKAHAAYLADGNIARAAYCAWFSATDFRNLGEDAVASGWINKARRLLSDHPEVLEHGYLALTDSGSARDGGALDDARAHAERAIEIARRFGSADLEGLAIQTLGRALIRAGRHEEGVRLLDEAMTFVLADQVAPFAMGWIYCDVLSACMEIVDLRRASEWTARAVAWCDTHSDVSPFHGICRLHRVEVTSLQGDWREAETQALRVFRELETLIPPMAAEAIYASGEICRLRGDLTAAEDAFRQANALGRDPQPGLALVRLAQGKREAAAAALRLALTDGTGTLLQRAHLYAAQVHVAVALDDHDTARAAAGELDRLAGSVPSPGLAAIADTSNGELLVFIGRPEDAHVRLRRAQQTWRDLRLPYEEAQARVLMGLICRRAGDEESARLEFDAALAVFERLGARLDAANLRQLMQPASEFPGGLSAREVEVLQLVAAGKTNRQIAAEMVISEHTVSRHLQNIFRKLDVQTRAAATAFAFEHALVPR